MKRPFHTLDTQQKHRLDFHRLFRNFVHSFASLSHLYFIPFYSILSTLLHNILFNLCTIVRYRCAYSVRQFIQLMIGLSSVYRSDVIQFRNCEIDGRIINIKANKQHQQRERWASLINGIGIGKD